MGLYLQKTLDNGADITPPVALAAYAGAAIADANPMKTGITATRLAIAAFIIPFMIVYNPAMVLVDSTVWELLFIGVTALIGMFAIASALEGWFLGALAWPWRIVLAAGGLALIIPGAVTDLVGLAVCAAAYLRQTKFKKVKA